MPRTILNPSVPETGLIREMNLYYTAGGNARTVNPLFLALQAGALVTRPPCGCTSCGMTRSALLTSTNPFDEDDPWSDDYATGGISAVNDNTSIHHLRQQQQRVIEGRSQACHNP